MAATIWTRTAFTLSILFWILQCITIISHISFITRWIGFLAVKRNIENLPHIYTTLLISTTFFTALLIIEMIFQLRTTLTLERYRKLQLIKIRIFLVEMVALGILSHGVEDATDTVTNALLLTACAGIPFSLSSGLAAFMRRERQGMEMMEKEADEETPLLS